MSDLNFNMKVWYFCEIDLTFLTLKGYAVIWTPASREFLLSVNHFQGARKKV